MSRKMLSGRRKKISVITLHRVKNYGSVLQAFATQRVLEDLGYEVEFADYWRPDLRDMFDDVVSRSNWNGGSVRRSVYRAAWGHYIDRNRKVFNGFVERHLNLSLRSYYSLDDLQEHPPQADVYCVGSDQVWNDDYNVGGSEPFFLEYAPESSTKIALSSSIGKTEISEQEGALVRRHLPSFTAISVRERSSVDLLEAEGIRAEHVLDPTLMINSRHWGEISEVRSDAGRYLLVYQLNKGAEFEALIRNISRDLGLTPVRLSVKSLARWRTRGRVVQPTVEEYVSLFRNAGHVVTDSFHGTAFSINFNTPFTSFLPPKYGERIESVLEMTGLQRRLATSSTDYDVTPFDWNPVNDQLEGARKRTQDFVESALSSAKHL